MEGNINTEDLNKGLKDILSHIGKTTDAMDHIMKSVVPQSIQKKISIEIVEKKGFWGFGRKVKNVNATAHISMNNLLVIDFSDKLEMQKYFDGLK